MAPWWQARAAGVKPRPRASNRAHRRVSAVRMVAVLLLLASAADLPPLPPDSEIPAEVRAACRADAWRHCRSDVLLLDRERVRRCLREKRAQLSPVCGSRFRDEGIRAEGD